MKEKNNYAFFTYKFILGHWFYISKEWNIINVQSFKKDLLTFYSPSKGT